MSELRELAERCEAATADYQRRLLSEAYREIFGGPECITIDRWPGYQSPRWDAFHKKLEAEAFLNAAMMLVPEGWHVGMLTECDEDNSSIACLTENEEPCRDAVGKGVDMTLSLVAAALRAREEDRG